MLGPPIGYVAIVDDYVPYARSIAQYFEPRVPTVVAYRVAEALELLDRPGLVGAIVDVRLGAHDGTVSVAIPLKRRHPDADIRVVSGEYHEEPDRKAARAGCFFMAKDGGLEPIKALAPEWARRARGVDEATEPIDRELDRLFGEGTLTFPQIECIRMATVGLSYVQIADELDLSPQAIEGMSSRMQEHTGRTLIEWAISLCEGTVRLARARPPRRGRRARRGGRRPLRT
jgi:DNA-binding NarL/FixJ family response regulator